MTIGEKKKSPVKNHAVALIYNSTNLCFKDSCASYPRSFERTGFGCHGNIWGEQKQGESRRHSI